MFPTSNCILKNRKLLETISYKVHCISLLHVSKNHQSLSGRKLLNLRLYGIKRHPLNTFSVSRLISTKNVATQVTLTETSNEISKAANESVSNVSSSSNVNIGSNVEALGESASKASTVPESSQQDLSKEVLDFPIPEPPTPKLIESGLVDPPFEQLGLGGWSPVGLVQNSFEFLHVSMGLPWWECILFGTCVVRLALFPLMVMSQKNSTILQNNQPRLQELHAKINEAQQRGDQLEVARNTQDLMIFMKNQGVSPVKGALIPLFQAPIFISFFMGLREMANIPIKSMHEGGLFWFVDLTVPDQFYILPIITSLTLLTTIEVATDASRLTSQNQYLMKYIFRCVPIVMLPFTITFPSAILLYWTSSNLISLLQTFLFKVPKVRAFLRLPIKIKHPEEKLSVAKPKNLIQGVKNWWKNTRAQGELSNMSKRNQMTFNQAGRGAVPKTYKYDPTLLGMTSKSATPNPGAATVQAKKG